MNRFPAAHRTSSSLFFPATPQSKAAAVVLVAGLAGASISLTLLAEDSPSLPPPIKRKVDFAKDIQPLLREKCHQCHGPSRKEAGLRLDRRDDAINGGNSGPAFIAEKSADSRLIKYVAAVDPDVVMPPEGERLSDEQIGILRAWIDQGARWPEL
jgi:mono/diheme cytochrome c family protein